MPSDFVAQSKPLTAVVAATPRGVIGLDGQMPWKLREDLRRFKRLTMGGTLIMGRKTYDSIGRPLPGRRTIVVTRNRQWSSDGVDVAASPETAVEMAAETATYIVGGAEIYRQLLPKCDRLFLTRVFSSVAGDTHLELPLEDFLVIEQFRIPAGPRDDVPTEFLRMLRQETDQNS
ncbi:MAG: dihydrofolate reductase [Planctomycetota bacterium]